MLRSDKILSGCPSEVTRKVLSAAPELSNLPESELDALAFAFVEEELQAGARLRVRRGESTCFVILSGALETEAGDPLFAGSLTAVRDTETAQSYVASGVTRIARLHRSACAMLLGSRSELSEAVRRMFQANSVDQQLSAFNRQPSSAVRRPSSVNRRPWTVGRRPRRWPASVGRRLLTIG